MGLAGVMSKVAANDGILETLVAKAGSNASGLARVGGDVDTNDADIAALNGDVAANTGNIMTNADGIMDLNGDAGTLDTKANANKMGIAMLST